MNKQTELFVPRVVTVAAAWRSIWGRDSLRAMVRDNIKGALGSDAFNPKLPNIRQIRGY